jgi:hypothetical protein
VSINQVINITNNESNHKDLPIWTIEEVRPLWEQCCNNLGVDHNRIKLILFPCDELPDWHVTSGWLVIGEANWEDGTVSPILIFLIDNLPKRNDPLKLREVFIHELVHAVLKEANGKEAEDIALTILRRRNNWSQPTGYLKSRAFHSGLGFPQDGWTLFHWAKYQKMKSGTLDGFNQIVK